MHIVSVSALVPLPRRYAMALSYYAKDPISPGSLVTVPFQKRFIPAIVIASEPLSGKKLTIKKGAFALKRIHKVLHAEQFFHPSLISIARDAANYYQEPIGQVLKSFIPSALLSSLPHARTFENPPQVLQHPRPDLVLGTYQERLDYYTTIIREAYAKKQSVALFAPTIAILEHITESLTRLPFHPIVIHGSLTPKQMRLACERALQKSSPSVVLASPVALGLLSGHEHIVIIEDPDSPHYIRQDHPRIHMARPIISFAQYIRAKCIEGKHIPNMNDIYTERSMQYLSSRIKTHAPGALIDMREQKNPVISRELEILLKTRPGRTLLFTTRKGFYTFVICSDCSSLLLCPSCQIPLVLYESNKRRYHCHRCERIFPADISCATCKGWNLKGYGVGTQRVLDELRTLKLERPLWIYDDTVAPRKTTRKTIVDQYLASSDGILVGTDAILEEPRLISEHCAVVNLDNLFSIPDFRINERIALILLRLADKATESFVWIQTRFPSHQLFSHFIRQDIKGFLQQECKERIHAGLPPATLFIKATIHDPQRERREKKIKALEEFITPLSEYVSSYPAFHDHASHHLLISINEQTWVQNAEDLKGILATHAGDWDIAVDPENIL